MKLSVCVITYNHATYIRQCIDSIINQNCNFDYEIIIGDDCSTDKTQEILLDCYKSYPNLIRLLFNNKNIGISDNYRQVLETARGEYIALCEGDDYWTDSLKLRKQVDFLDSHRNYGFVGSYNQLLFPNNNLIDDPYNYLPKPIIDDDWELYGNVFEYAKYGPVTRTVSLCFRRSIIDPYVHRVGVGCDLVLQTILARYSLFAKYRYSMCVYRQGGVSTDYLSIEKQIYYNNWHVQNRLLQKELFPEDCFWDENELRDREFYLRLCDSIKNCRLLNAFKYKRKLCSHVYKSKPYSRFLLGPITFLLLNIFYKITK